MKALGEVLAKLRDAESRRNKANLLANSANAEAGEHFSSMTDAALNQILAGSLEPPVELAVRMALREPAERKLQSFKRVLDELAKIPVALSPADRKLLEAMLEGAKTDQQTERQKALLEGMRRTEKPISQTVESEAAERNSRIARDNK